MTKNDRRHMTEPDFIIAITGLLLSIGSVIGIYIDSKITARKNELDTVTTRLQAGIEQVNKDNDKLRQRIDDVEKDNLELRAVIRTMEAERRANVKRIEVLEDQVAVLENQLLAAGITPVTKKGKP